MNTMIFTIYDAVAGRFLDPFFGPTMEYALRGFRELVNTPDHQFNKYPADYVLYHIGDYDAENAHIEACQPHNLGIGTQFVNTPKVVAGTDAEAINGVKEA